MERTELDVLMIRANACMSTGSFAEARCLLERVIEEEPAHGVAHAMLGWICWALLDDHERALNHFRYAVRWAPGRADTWIHYLHLLANIEAEAELHEASGRALAIPGIDRAAVHAIIAGYLERTGRDELALGRYRMALRSAVSAGAEAEHRASIRRVGRRSRRSRLNWLGLY